jgi:predicted transcriptional regulator
MRKLYAILEARLKLSDTQKAAIAYISSAPTPQMAYSIVTGARNSVTARSALEQAGYVETNDEDKSATLTPQGEEILTSENLVDEMGELTERGEELIDQYVSDRQDWKTFESLKRLL